MNEVMDLHHFDLPYLAYSYVDRKGTITSASLNWKGFGLKDVLPGNMIEDAISAFWGIFPVEQEGEVRLPLVLSENGKFLDLMIKTFDGGYLVFALDVTEKAVALQELQQVRNELELFNQDIYKVFPERAHFKLQGTREELVQQTKNLIYTSRLAALGEMASGLSHEINNPLMIIQGGIEVVERLLKIKSEFSGQIEDFVNRSKQAVDRIVFIINGLKNFARQDQGFVKETVPLTTVIDGTFVFCFEMLKMHKIKLCVDPVPQINVDCRPLQISQVLFNLLKNADDALLTMTDESRKWIRVNFVVTPIFIQINVSNGGALIPFHDQGKIFQPFFTTKEVGAGAGLGLSISRGIMQEHEGELIFDPDAPDTTFIVKLPRSKLY